MTAIDRAFIRAYETDQQYGKTDSTMQDAGGMPATVPMPHVVFPPAQSNAAANPVEGHSGLASTTEEDIARENRLASRAMHAGVSTTGRRPLSEYAPLSPPQQQGFKPALEVDGFRWSTVCDRITHQHREMLEPTVDRLLSMADQGRSLVGFLGVEPNAGCTSMALCLARLLVAKGKTVAMVDGDFYHGGQGDALSLASHLGVAIGSGWEDVLAGRIALAEGVIRSLNDGISILPLADRSTDPEPFQSIQASVTAGVLRYHFDVVLFDLGCAVDQRQTVVARAIIEHCRLDTMLLVTGSPHRTEKLQRATAVATVAETVCLGVLENQIDDFDGSNDSSIVEIARV